MTTVLPPSTPQRACEVVLGELDAFVELIRALDPEEWSRPTDCAGWTVRDVVAHVAGALEEGARPTAQLRRVLVGPRRYPGLGRLDAMNQLQVDDRRDVTTGQLVEEVEARGPRAARARRRLPRLFRAIPVPPGFSLPRGSTFGYLADVIYPRDLWMHRIDISRATGRPLRATETEAEVVAQVVRDLADGWDGPATTLVLTGHGAGTWTLGDGSPFTTLEVDAVEACRLLSGRLVAPVVTASGDLRAEELLLASRIAF